MKIEIMVIGNQKAGKTSLIKRYLYAGQNLHLIPEENYFSHKYIPTDACDMKVKTTQIRDKYKKKRNLRLQIWDTSGKEKYAHIIRKFLKRIHGFVITYDVTDKSGLSKVEEWIKFVNKECKSSAIKYLVGNKIDLYEQRCITSEEGKSLADKYGFQFHEVSAKTETGIVEVFESLGKKVFESIPAEDDFEPTGVNCCDGFKDILLSFKKYIPFN